MPEGPASPREAGERDPAYSPTPRSAVGAVVAVHVGRVAPLGPQGVPSGFVKHAVAGPVAAATLGLAGDAQADLRLHGGPDKAVYCYPVEHYARWLERVPEHAALLVPGGFGENLATRGLSEGTVCIGDVHRIGSARFQVAQSRQPCFKLGLRFGDPRMLRAMLDTGFSGWYLRVLEPGTLAAGDAIALAERPNPGWPVARFNRLFVERDATAVELAELAVMPGLAEPWRAVARMGAGR